MKKIHSLYILCLLTAMALTTTCQDDTEQLGADTSAQSIRVTGNLSTDTDSRTSYTIGESSVTCAWVAGDTIALFSSSQTTPLLYVAKTSGSTTEFEALGEEISVSEDETVYAWYPYQSSKSSTYPNAYLPNIRNQYYDGETIPSDLDFVYASAQVSDGELQFSFSHLFAFLHLRIATEVLSEYLGIVIGCSGSDEKVAYYQNATLDMTSGSVEYNTGTGINYYIDSEVLSSNEVIDCYVAMLPLSASNTLNFSWIITSNASTITSIQLKKSAPTTGLLAGHIYSLTIGDVDDEDGDDDDEDGDDDDEDGDDDTGELAISPTSVSIEASQSTFEITVTSNVEYEVTTSADWLTLNSDNDGTLTFTAEENDSSSSRTATITVTAGDLKKTVSVTQKGVTLTINKTSVEVDASGGTFTVTVTSNVDYEVTTSADWLTLTSDNDGTLTFTAEENTTYSERTATITITAGSVTRTVTVTQEGATYTSTDYSEDGEIYTLQTHTKGDGMKFFILGEAFSDRLIADDTYKGYVDLAYEAMFTEEPFASYKDYFDVYYVNVVSENEYIGGSTAFGTTYDSGSLDFDYSLVEKYIKNLSESGGSVTNTVGIVIVNGDNTTTRSITLLRSDGFSAAYCITGDDDDDFKALIHHEALGHGFANLADEYEEYSGTYPYASDLATEQSKYYFYLNIDTTDDKDEVLWSYYFTDSNYDAEGIGIYEGADCYSYGVYRSTEYSIMRYNKGGFNAPSRQEIYRRIITRSGGTYSFDDFLQYDLINCKAYSSGIMSRSSGKTRRALLGAPPRVVIK